MKPISNFDQTKATYSGESSPRIPAGAYVARITEVKDVPLDPETGKGQYLAINFDIAEGQYTGYYAEQFTRWGGNWHGTARASYKDKAAGMFKGLTSAVEEANPGYTWEWAEQTLVGKLVGVTLGEEEYWNKKTNQISTVVRQRGWCKVQDVRDGKVQTPKLRTLSDEEKAKFGVANAVPVADADDELPF